MTELQKNTTFHYEFQVLETHLDTFGHMNHATYLTVFEQARWEFINERGYGLREIMQHQVGPTILELSIKYKRELRLRDRIRIESVCTEWSGKIGRVKQKMINQKGEECAEIDLIFGVFDLQKRKLVQAPEAWLHAIGVPT
jgi:acyl-CoA thioester hydrolase